LSFKIFGKDSLREKLLCGFAVAMFSAVLMIYFCAQDVSEFSLHASLILSGIMFLLGAVSYIPSLIIFRRAFTAMIFCIVCWLGFHTTPLYIYYLKDNWPWAHGILASIAVCITIIAVCVTVMFRHVKNTIRNTCLFMCVLAVIFFINFETLYSASSGNFSIAQSQIPIKKDFTVNKDTKSPNIYWIHPDGMLGVNAFKKYFNDDQEEFLTALKERGFEINNGANFEARHFTGLAIPVLMNPYTYDNWTREFVDTLVTEKLLLNSTSTLRYLRLHSEFQYAFAAKNYALNVVGLLGSYYPMYNGKVWVVGLNGTRKKILSPESIENNWVLEAMNFQNRFFALFMNYVMRFLNIQGDKYQVHIPEEMNKKIFMNGWDASNSRLDFTDGLYDTLHGGYPAPKLTFIHDATPHYPFVHASDGAIAHSENNMNPLDYYTQHVYAAKILIGTIDLILEADPDAVIAIQADHGLHGNSEADFKKAFGDKADAKELWNSTMSALRVPPEYKTGEEHYALETPLNMTRYLVNSFVGKNYEYLQE